MVATTHRAVEAARGAAPVDAVVLSHLHGDHFDRTARHGLAHDLPVLTTPDAVRRLRRWGFEKARGLETWDSSELERDGASLRVTAVPGTHAPGPVRALLPPVMGSILELRRSDGPAFRVYVSGDTLYRPWLHEIVDRTGPLDAAVLHLGGTRILGITVTMDGGQGADLMELLDPRVTVPVHHDDYGVFKSPLQDFLDQGVSRGLRDRIRTVTRGETVSLR